MSPEKLQEISNHARYLIIETIIKAGCGHPGGSLSSIDMLTALYFKVLNIDVKNQNWDERDRFILSKGHSSIGLYTILYLKGFISKEELDSFRQDGSSLWGHIDIKTDGIEVSTGSLGHGLSIGVGRALAAKIDKKDHKTYVLMGDGETQEGSVWEAAMAASHYKLDNLIAITDRNRIQQCGFTEDIISLEPYSKKWESFGWNIIDINGHDMQQILRAIESSHKSDKPFMIISNTIKGKGVSFMENDNAWHGGGAIKKFEKEARAELSRYSNLDLKL